MAKVKHLHRRIILLTAGLLIFGLVALISATGPTGFMRFGDTYYFPKRQLLFGILPGIVVFLLAWRTHVDRYRRLAPYLLPASLILLVLPLIPRLGAGYGGGAWINAFGVSFQPSEPVKLLAILYFAWWLERRGKASLRTFWGGLLPFVIVVGIYVGMLMLQSDLGTTGVYMAIFFSMYIAAGAAWSHLGALSVAGASLFYLFIKIAPYRADRLKIFLRPDLDPQGVGYHINQALLAVGSGGIFGLGLGMSRQKFLFLPEVSSDSIFAVIAEEMGFLVSAAIIIAFVWLVLLGFRLAASLEDDFSRYVVVGVSSWIAFQAFLNVAAMVGLMPLTGVPLPFMSHGGSAILAELAAIGVLAGVARTSSERKR